MGDGTGLAGFAFQQPLTSLADPAMSRAASYLSLDHWGPVEKNHPSFQVPMTKIDTPPEKFPICKSSPRQKLTKQDGEVWLALASGGHLSSQGSPEESI